jgi:hypothetical protein
MVPLTRTALARTRLVSTTSPDHPPVVKMSSVCPTCFVPGEPELVTAVAVKVNEPGAGVGAGVGVGVGPGAGVGAGVGVGVGEPLDGQTTTHVLETVRIFSWFNAASYQSCPGVGLAGAVPFEAKFSSNLIRFS